MQERLLIGADVEIADFDLEVEVRQHDRREHARQGETLELPRREQEQRRRGEADGQHQQEGRQDAKRPARVEAGEREAARPQIRGDLADDQVAGDHEEDVDADKTADEARNADVIGDHGDDGDGAQAIDMRLVVGHPPGHGGARMHWPIHRIATLPNGTANL